MEPVPEEPAITKSFKLPKIFADQLSTVAKSHGQSVSEYVRDLVVHDLTKDSKQSTEEQNAEALRVIRTLSNLLRGDVATLARVMLIEVAKWERGRADSWLDNAFNRTS